MSLKCPHWQFVYYLSMKDDMLLRRTMVTTHQCQAWQAVDAPHAGEREAGSLLRQLVELLTSQRTATATVEAEKVPEGCPLPLTAAPC